MKITILSVCRSAFLFTFSSQTFAVDFRVNRPDDAGNGICNDQDGCTLRDAVLAASAAASDDTISFEFFLPNVTLTSQITINNAGTLSIDGRDADDLTIDGGAGTNRIFFVNGAEVTIQEVTLSGGNGAGAAVNVRGGGLVLESVVVKHNSASGAFAFGAIALEGTGVVIANSTISGNTDFTGCPAIYAVGGVSPNVRNTTVSGNSTTAAGLGAGALCV